MTDTQRYLHNYHVHQIPVPTTNLSIDNYGTDKLILKQLQHNDPQFKIIYESELGHKDIDDGTITTNERRMMNNHEFIYGDDELL